MKKKKIVTIEKLAHMVQKGFEETAKKSDVDARFGKVDEKFDAVDEKFRGIDKKLDEIDTRLYEIDSRLYNMGKDIGEIKRNFISRYEFEILSDRVRILEKRASISSSKTKGRK